jgi:hypothetical protein
LGYVWQKQNVVLVLSNLQSDPKYNYLLLVFK